MFLRDCKCVSAPKNPQISKNHNKRQYSITYWCVVEDNFPSGVYFRHFQWVDTAKTVYREGSTAKCTMIDGQYWIIET